MYGHVPYSPCSGKVTWFSGSSIDCLPVGPPGPLWASWALLRQALMTPLGLMVRALMGSPGP